MTPYLIQRGKFANRDHKKGIDSILSFDYMGSAEFEWGALPDSLDDIRANIKDYSCIDVVINSKTITVFCKESQKEDVSNYLDELSQGKHRLKEYSDFDNIIYPNEKYLIRGNTEFWWDINNHFMWWVQDKTFEKNFKEKIK